ncbi:dihydrodipicolinate synthase family protein [Allokutzneria sp. A3M-2-11 16]|uniref:dihydrodipicolinate synthase family protein n=1 Tax=Allokutzneria sp. A3M-2-11 16 TaxID=2962043 RepID=UPI0020B81037|nr:dihydrodipicolinate synthase family protein [Allokutzneria sp. A3M-2-11 16]MCP3804628.1 dihydrodipicolinate synthase family protein [Allokutzneria sp. A3M-2-11 16]
MNWFCIVVPGTLDAMTLTGLYVPLITPFDRAGAVALGALESLAHQVLQAGASGLVALGTTAEPSALTPGERRTVLTTVARVCREREAPLIVGANTEEALRELADTPEVAAALTLVPPFVRPGEEGVIAHFAGLAATSPVPLIVYDVPERTGQRLSANALRRLAAVPWVIGTKHAPGGITADTVEFLAQPQGISVLGGDDVFIAPLLAMGAQGGILATAHVATEAFVALISAWRAGDLSTARTLGGPLSALSAALLAEPNPSVIKAVLHAQGRIPTPEVRLPLINASEAGTIRALTCLDNFSAE